MILRVILFFAVIRGINLKLHHHKLLHVQAFHLKVLLRHKFSQVPFLFNFTMELSKGFLHSETFRKVSSFWNIVRHSFTIRFVLAAFLHV